MKMVKSWSDVRAWVIIPGSGAKEAGTERGFARGVRVEGENDGRERTTRIYACKPERPLYVVEAVIYDTYRSQLRVMALTLVFMAILFLVAFHGRRRLRSLSPAILSVRDPGPYAKQPVILVWFTFPSTPKLYSALSTLPGKWLRLRTRPISLLWPFLMRVARLLPSLIHLLFIYNRLYRYSSPTRSSVKVCTVIFFLRKFLRASGSIKKLKLVIIIYTRAMRTNFLQSR